MGIANRDIKLENTLLMDLSERPVLKLCDFGYSKDELCASISKTMCGEDTMSVPLRKCFCKCCVQKPITLDLTVQNYTLSGEENTSGDPSKALLQALCAYLTICASQHQTYVASAFALPLCV